MKQPPSSWRYRQDLARARADAKAEFASADPDFLPMLEDLVEEVAKCVLSIECDCNIDSHTAKLMASFLRTAIVSADLISASELIEAVALNRKQIELIARLRELENEPATKLRKKTPNVRHLSTRLKELYSSMSSSAHSSDYGSLSLLGYYGERIRRAHPIYPEFTENTQIIFFNWCQIAFEFSLWALNFKTAKIDGYVGSKDESAFRSLFERYKKLKSTSNLSEGGDAARPS